MEQETFRKLLDKYLTGDLNTAEKAMLSSMIAQPEHKAALEGFVQQVMTASTYEEAYPPDIKERLDVFLNARMHPVRMRAQRIWWAAASIILFIGATVAIIVSSDRQSSPPVATVVQQYMDRAPGRNGAILTLADGSEVLLDSVASGTVVSLQGGAAAKIVNGALLYESNGNELMYNKITTPKGRQFHLTLPDGTGVWLNSASTIRYPTVFLGNERRVEMAGEGYFEVAKNKKMPFRVNINSRAEVEVLGTHFNINAYENEENITATLIEGSVEVKVLPAPRSVTGSSSKVASSEPPGSNSPVAQKRQPGIVLKPGQQAQISDAVRVINDANIDNVTAWKTGFFIFTDLTFDQVMRQLERWYDIEVVFEKGIPERQIRGEMTRNTPLTSVLKYFEKIGIRYRLEGRKLTILP
ncbi:FecR family protein [Chitinophaga cymbidii]|uniref:Iron dicitrate transporter FecR n=1 Tax=Chitinophaga cymbidii TaxID=1096750 RepID=A0A512RPH9_9BACT|nr:FecR family protein [Chitinophaga cymbidii]GEP97608.1 iron dicitrate transporter FecR [Chitinophaga cymbidii]